MLRSFAAVSLVAAVVQPGFAQWDPSNGQWGKSDATDLRVMTWNIEDGICSSNDKLDNSGDWNGLVRIVASLQPDVLILQECGDNGGNGTGTGLDSTTTLTTVLDLFFHGGNDPFQGGAVTSYVQQFVPGYDLPNSFVNTTSDG
ncbi:MAG: hypothetical protein KDA29_15475, partial [Phycisphaerales bacterium]|nr:hypothetical protein [Phycisphaerales bacterium]